MTQTVQAIEAPFRGDGYGRLRDPVRVHWSMGETQKPA